MKPLKIEFQAFGPYAGYEAVDFSALASKGLFLICGKTGIGKTMILDAMTFALFGKSSGHGRDSFEAMRCTRADHDITTFVKFEFENYGRYYLFERRIDRKRKNLVPSYNLMEREEGGEWQVVLENAKDGPMTAKAEEIIGLSYEQFCQVIILPQGKFEKLLTSASNEKESILSSIFGEYKWLGIANRFLEEAEGRRNSLNAVKDRIESSLKEENCESISELELTVKKKTDEMKALDENFQKADYDRIIKEQQEILTLANRFSDLHKAENKIKELDGKKDERDRSEKTLSDAKRADKVRVLLESLDEAEKALQNRQKMLEAAKKSEEECKIRSEEASEKLKKHTELEEDIESKKTRSIQYEGKRADYENIDRAGENLTQKAKAVKTAETEENGARKKYEDLSKELVTINNEYEKQNSEHSLLLKQYLEGITGELAKGLKAGEPCPVCGSLEHPHKAESTENSVTEDMVNLAKEELDRKYEEMGNLSGKVNEAKIALDEKKAQTLKAKGEVAAAQAAVNELSGHLVEGIKTLKELDDQIRSLNEAVAAYNDKKKELEEAEKECKEAYKGAVTKTEVASNEAEDAKKARENADNALQKGLKDNGISSREEAAGMMMTPEDQEQLGNDIAEYDARVKAAKDALKELTSELEGKIEPDGEKSREAIDNAISAKEEYSGKRAGFDNEIKRLSRKVSDLRKEGDGIEEKIMEAEADCAFARKLRGDSGTGLQRYVLGIMFSSVVAAANKMLELVHGGRYRLFRSDEGPKGAKKKGLELKVYDKNSGDHEGRFVNTLSGGEKFLASLALSIGMSTIAQKSGIKIEALFIDEGFGSLDDESIGDAMSVLKSIQEANGLVGIISHVQILQDQIPCKLRVESDGKGSHIVRTLG